MDEQPEGRVVDPVVPREPREDVDLEELSKISRKPPNQQGESREVVPPGEADNTGAAAKREEMEGGLGSPMKGRRERDFHTQGTEKAG